MEGGKELLPHGNVALLCSTGWQSQSFYEEWGGGRGGGERGTFKNAKKELVVYDNGF